jgi:serum/glucocorticoid-regulated kinase 2
MESSNYDLLFFSNDKEIIKIIGNEHIVYSDKITKISSFSIRQERNLVLTNESMYIFQNKKFKRQLKYEDICGITFSNISNDFVVHGAKEYDLHFSHSEKFLIIYIIIKCYENKLKKPLTICEIEEKNLKAYITSKKDKKKDPNFTRMDESKAIDTQTYIIDYDPVERNKRSYTEALGSGKINMIQNIIEEFPQKINTEIIFSNDENGKNLIYKDFDYIKLIGWGNISKIFLSQLKKNQKYYAIKSISKKIVENPSSIREKVKIIEDLNHPFLINIQFCFQTNNKIYFVSPYIQGEELSYHIKKNKNLKEDKVKFYAASLVLALDYLHKHHIIYRDFSPNNIIINKDGYIQLTPFHFEKIFDIKKEILEKVEKTEYNPPEYLSDNIPQNLQGADWWNLGVVIFEMIYSVPPFYTDDENKLKEFIDKTELKFPKNPPISETTKDFIKQLLNKNPEERLGYKNGFEEIKSHDYFKEYDFDNLLNQKLETPYKPEINGILEGNKRIEEKYTYEDMIKYGLLITN